MNFFFDTIWVRHARQSFLGAFRQSLLYREWESGCVRVVHAATGNNRRVRIGGYFLINCYPTERRWSAVDRCCGTQTLRCDVRCSTGGYFAKTAFLVDACFDCVTSNFFHALISLRGHEGKLTTYQHLLLLFTHVVHPVSLLQGGTWRFRPLHWRSRPARVTWASLES